MTRICTANVLIANDIPIMFKVHVESLVSHHFILKMLQSTLGRWEPGLFEEMETMFIALAVIINVIAIISFC